MTTPVQASKSPKAFRECTAVDTEGAVCAGTASAATSLGFSPKDLPFGSVEESEHTAFQHESLTPPANSNSWQACSGSIYQAAENYSGAGEDALFPYANALTEPDPLPHSMLPVDDLWQRASKAREGGVQQQDQPPEQQPDDQVRYSVVGQYEQARLMPQDSIAFSVPPHRSEQIPGTVTHHQFKNQDMPPSINATINPWSSMSTTQNSSTAGQQILEPSPFPANFAVPAAIPYNYPWNGGAPFHTMMPGNPTFLSIAPTPAALGVEKQQFGGVSQPRPSYWGSSRNDSSSRNMMTDRPLTATMPSLATMSHSNNSVSSPCFPAGKKRKARDKDRPKKPLSAYNIFFKEERARMIEEMRGETSSVAESTEGEVSSSISGQQGPNHSSDQMNGDSTNTRHVVSENTSDETKRKRKKERLGIGFKKLAKEIGKRWKLIDLKRLEEYRQRANIDKKRYDREMAMYMVKKREKLSQARAQLESTVPDETKRRYFDTAGKQTKKP